MPTTPTTRTAGATVSTNTRAKTGPAKNLDPGMVTGGVQPPQAGNSLK